MDCFSRASETSCGGGTIGLTVFSNCSLTAQMIGGTQFLTSGETLYPVLGLLARHS